MTNHPDHPTSKKGPSMASSPTTQTLTCEQCGRYVPRGLATVRTTLRAGVPAPVAWCRTCRPVFIPAQRSAS